MSVDTVKGRLTLVGKVIIFLPLTAMLVMAWLPYWIITGGHPFPKWVCEVWKWVHQPY